MQGLAYLFIGGLGMYGYTTGRFTEIVERLKNPKNESASTARKNGNSYTETMAPQPTIVVAPSTHNRSTSYLIPVGVAGFVALGGYYYYIHSSGTKKVIHRVEETAEETQNLVQQTDDNNSKRFEILDDRNEDRAKHLEIEIRTEQRSGFTLISEQIYCLQQVAIQTLNAVANSMNHNNANKAHDDELDNNVSNEKLLGYCDKAQEMADTLLSEAHMLKIKDNNIKDIKAEIELRNRNANNYNVIHNHSNDITPGGPDDIANDENEVAQRRPKLFDVNRNQSTLVTNVSASSCPDNEEKGFMQNVSEMTSSLNILQMGYAVWQNKEYVAVGGASLLALGISYKVVDYFSNRHETNSHSNYQIIQQRAV
eukprot:CAMPEP_0197079848 /NCGR_PEP_ID=MMETSP1384-20130603/213832_1 /TAXON_ID=29189 /ORGANISM="Ammonia sp." /LENGTH=367 /DNA_ID=CAMNT_0042518729 /DNA_START=64 /DNA_END=1167 /DNA_ORIENTATION=-